MDPFNTVTADLRTVRLFPQDPSRNHRAYRLTVAKLEPPIIPFMPLLIKGGTVIVSLKPFCHSRLTFCHNCFFLPFALLFHVLYFFVLFSRHDIHSWGQQDVYWQFGQFWENGEVLKGAGRHRVSEHLFICSIHFRYLLPFVLQRMIANTLKIVRHCRSQPFSKSQNCVLVLFTHYLWHCSSFQFTQAQNPLWPARTTQKCGATYASSTWSTTKGR